MILNNLPLQIAGQAHGSHDEISQFDGRDLRWFGFAGLASHDEFVLALTSDLSKERRNDSLIPNSVPEEKDESTSSANIRLENSLELCCIVFHCAGYG